MKGSEEWKNESEWRSWLDRKAVLDVCGVCMPLD